MSDSSLKEEAVACAKCGELPNDVLILTCDHNLCLRCASLNLQRENRKASEMQGKQNQNSFQTVICEICQIATVLDPASATELLTMNNEDGGELEDENNQVMNDFSDQEFLRDEELSQQPQFVRPNNQFENLRNQPRSKVPQSQRYALSRPASSQGHQLPQYGAPHYSERNFDLQS